MKKAIYLILLLPFVFAACKESGKAADAGGRWSVEKAKAWYDRHEWMTGCNYIASTAINQLEMWQAETFDPRTIDRELGWAEELGFNTMRVYLHSLVWQQDAEGFKKRIDGYLDIAHRHGIKTMFVFFDDCWNPEATVGKQPEPKPGIHNSGWVQDPPLTQRTDSLTLYRDMQAYVKDILTTFKDDNRVLMWDMYNEPGNSGHLTKSLSLLRKVFEWAREVGPLQPITAGVWSLDFYELNKFQIENSDIITYHCYANRDLHQQIIHFMKYFGRPIVCTEWMARQFESTFESIMPMLKEQHVGAINWGFVAGKSNTIFAWDDPRPDGGEPDLWFHDILRADGTPYSSREVEAIKKLTRE